MYKKSFDLWNNIKKKTNENERGSFKEGDIWWIRCGVNIGTEEDGKGQFFKRPFLVIRKFSASGFLAVPITTNLEKSGTYYLKLELKIGERNLLLNQVKYMDSKRLDEFVLKINDNKLKEVKKKIKELI